MGEGNVRVLIVVSELFRGKVVVARDEEDDGVRHIGGWEASQRAGRVLTATKRVAWVVKTVVGF